ncbi:MAG: hypothetical protein KAG96_02675 [Ichthyobacteriaceae bacterium]|nr:hypothetical protein [Ichthyobacteriaceae bacterium]
MKYLKVMLLLFIISIYLGSCSKDKEIDFKGKYITTSYKQESNDGSSANYSNKADLESNMKYSILELNEGGVAKKSSGGFARITGTWKKINDESLSVSFGGYISEVLKAEGNNLIYSKTIENITTTVVFTKK